MKKILFICTGNSARSIMAESLVNHLARQRYEAYSAGADPSGEVNPLTIKTLEENGISAEGLRSKPLTEFSGSEIDIVITVCDNARESCPVWPGKTEQYHWSLPDPASFAGSDDEKREEFSKIFEMIRARIMEFLKS